MEEMRRFDEILVGESKEFEKLYDEVEHVRYGKQFDQSPIHTDLKFAINSGFKNVIGYSGYLHGLRSEFYGNYLPGGSAICLSNSSKYPHEFYVNEKLRIHGTVLRRFVSTNCLEIKVEIYNSEKVFEDIGLVQCKL
jgi:acyl dehydratase